MDTLVFGMFEAKTHFSEIVEECMAGKEILVTKRGEPVVRIVPAKNDTRSLEDVLQKFRGIRERAAPGPSIRQLIDEGRHL